MSTSQYPTSKDPNYPFNVLFLMYYLCLCTLNCLVSYTPPSCLLVIYAIHFKRWISKYISACIIKTSHFQIWWISHIIWRINFNFMSQDGSCFIVLVFFCFFFNETVRKILEAKKQQKKKKKRKVKNSSSSFCMQNHAGWDLSHAYTEQ